jgi:transposase
MFLKRLTHRTCGKTRQYWALVESVRTARGPRHRLVSYLGELNATEQSDWAKLVERFDSPPVFRQRALFELEGDPARAEAVPDQVRVDLRRLRVERVREFGVVWLGLLIWQKLRLDELLAQHMPPGEEQIEWATVACLLVLARFAHPSSELHIADTWYDTTALADLLGVSPEQVNKDRLYRGLDELFPQKETLEKYLKSRLGELFPLEFDLLLYDVTSTYFEGECAANPKARRGYSRDNRPDCKQVCIALVVTREGVPFGYEVFAGNRHDAKTLQDIVAAMEKKYGQAERVWVFDRGVVSEENLKYLREHEGRYLVGTPRSQLRRFEQELLGQGWSEVVPGVEVKLVNAPDGAETFVLAKSRDRAAKEQAMHERFVNRIEEGLKTIATAASSGRLKDTEQAGRRIGRLLGKNSRGAGCFDVEVKPLDPAPGKAKLSVTWTPRNEWREWSRLSEGCYLLRTNLTGHSPEELWKMYMQLMDAEAAFRTHKHELVLRPIYHQKEKRVDAHILVCFLAYVLWKTLERWMEQAGLGTSPRPLLDALTRLKSMDVILSSDQGREIGLRCVSQPEPDLAVLLYRLGIAPPSRLLPPRWLALAPPATSNDSPM